MTGQLATLVHGETEKMVEIQQSEETAGKDEKMVVKGAVEAETTVTSL